MSVPSSTDPNRNPQPNHQGSDEIDLGQVFHYVGKVVKRFLRLLFDILNFFKRRFLLLLGILLLGFGLGYYWDYSTENKLYAQEIIVEPNYGSTTYLYNFVEKFDENLDRPGLKNTIPGVSLETLKKIKSISLYPIVDYKDILEYNNTFAKDNNGYLLLTDIEENLAQYRDQFKFHKIRFEFKGDDPENAKFISKFLTYLNSIEYFENLKTISQQDLKDRIQETEKSISFINFYTDRILKTPSDGTQNNIITIGGENDIPTVSSLLKEKDRLLELLARDKENLAIHSEVIKLIDNGYYTKAPGLLYKKAIVLPILLISIFLAFFLLKYVYKNLKRYSQEQ